MLELNINKWIFTWTILLIALELSQASNNHRQECEAKFKCSTEKNLVWAIANDRCFIFRNNCHLKLAQCDRQNEGKSALVKTDMKSCKQSCEMACTMDHDPVCAQFFEDENITFNNKCQMRNYMCNEERTYSFYQMGECAET